VHLNLQTILADALTGELFVLRRNEMSLWLYITTLLRRQLSFQVRMAIGS
jgi:hypothetical protein